LTTSICNSSIIRPDGVVKPDDTRRVLVDNIEGMASVSPGEGGRDVDVEFGVVDPEAEVAFGFGLRFGFGF
jgi:hypothetical protein